MQLINYYFSIDLYTVFQCTRNVLALSIFLQFLKMAPAPNFGVFFDFGHPLLTEVDFRMSMNSIHLLQKVMSWFLHCS